MSKPKTVAEFFIKHPERWLRDSYEDGCGNYCLMGAVDKIYGEDTGGQYYAAIYRLLREAKYIVGPIGYNDDKAKDVVDIINLCLAADV